ncbi:hypothetical protein ACOMHN_063974 [Nucella lapillus]
MDLSAGNLGDCELVPVETAEGQAAEMEVGSEVLQNFAKGYLEQEAKPTSTVTSPPSSLTSGSAVSALLSAFHRLENCLTSAQSSKRASPPLSPRPCQSQEPVYNIWAERRSLDPSRKMMKASSRRDLILRQRLELKRQLEHLEREDWPDRGTRPTNRHRRRGIKLEVGRGGFTDESDVSDDASSDESDVCRQRRRGQRGPRRLKDSSDSDDDDGRDGRRRKARRRREGEEDWGAKRHTTSPSSQGSNKRPRFSDLLAEMNKYRPSWRRSAGSACSKSRSRRRSPSSGRDDSPYFEFRAHKKSQESGSRSRPLHPGEGRNVWQDASQQKGQSNLLPRPASRDYDGDSRGSNLRGSPSRQDKPHSRRNAISEASEEKSANVVRAGEINGEESPRMHQSCSDMEKDRSKSGFAGVRRRESYPSKDAKESSRTERDDNDDDDDDDDGGDDGNKCHGRPRAAEHSHRGDSKMTKPPKQEFYTAMIAGDQGAMLASLHQSLQAVRGEVMAAVAGLRGEVAQLRCSLARSWRNSQQPAQGAPTGMAATEPGQGAPTGMAAMQPGQGAPTRMAATEDDAKVAELPEEFNFPLSTMDEIGALEERLTEPNFKDNMVSALASMGGGDLQSVVCGVMGTVVAASLAVKYDYHGRKGKLCFQNLLLRRTIFEGVRRIVPNVSDYDIYKRVTLWLTTSRDCDG